MKSVVHMLWDEGGAAAVEYGLIVAAIAAVVLLTVFYLGGYVEGSFQSACTAFSTADTGSNTSNVGHC